MSPQEVQRRIDSFPERCRAAGLKLTPQRAAVYGVLAGLDTHPTPETIYGAVRRVMPSISQGTVYKILDLLSGCGLLTKVATSGQAARYDARIDDHSHMVCTRCGTLADLDADALGAAPAHAAERAGFAVHKVEVLVEGHCAECRGPAHA